MSGPSPFNAMNLDAALALAAVGIFIFPAKVTLKEDRWAKAPCLKKWQTEASTDPQQIRAWWKQYPHAVPGIELGRSELLVLDADRHGNGPDGVSALDQLAERHRNQQETGGTTCFVNQMASPLEIAAGGCPPVSMCAGLAAGLLRLGQHVRMAANGGPLQRRPLWPRRSAQGPSPPCRNGWLTSSSHRRRDRKRDRKLHLTLRNAPTARLHRRCDSRPCMRVRRCAGLLPRSGRRRPTPGATNA